MRYYLDCEFNGFGGELLSLALVSEKGESLYLIYPHPAEPVPWVAENVIPILFDTPHDVENQQVDWDDGARAIHAFLKDDPVPHIIADWPDDLAYFSKAVMTGPGQMIALPRFRLDYTRVYAYPTDLPGAVQHNAWWDAMALRHLLLPAA